MNHEDLVGADHHRAVAVLKEAGNDVTMVVARGTTPTVTSPPLVRFLVSRMCHVAVICDITFFFIVRLC